MLLPRLRRKRGRKDEFRSGGLDRLALRHTPEGTRSGLRLSANAVADTGLTVQDDGAGVDAGDLPRLTDRFYLGERSRRSPRNELGLSLVAAVAELHAASLRSQNTQPGLRVELCWATGHGPKSGS